jgi:hypothetical protein
LTSGDSATLTFTWDTTGFAYGNYTLSAYADTLPFEIDIEDNSFTGGTVLVTIPGDITGDFKVNYLDLGRVIGNAYGKTPISLYWNPNADINGNDKINYLDLGILLAHFGQHYP